MSEPAHKPNVHPDLSLGEIAALELLRTRHPRATEALMELDNDAKSRVLDLLHADSQAPEAPSADAKAVSVAESPAPTSALSLKSDPVVSVEKIAPLAYGAAFVVSVSLALAGVVLVGYLSEVFGLDGFGVLAIVVLVLAIATGIMSHSRLFIDVCRINGRILADLRDRAVIGEAKTPINPTM